MQTQAQHTPGPWHWERFKTGDDTPYTAILYGQPNEHNDKLVTAMREDLAAFPYAIDTANARLIAAAPELLEALRGLFENCSMIHKRWGDGNNQREADAMIAKAHAAIARAEGR